MWIVFTFIMFYIYFYGYENPPEVFGGRSNKLQIITSPIFTAVVVYGSKQIYKGLVPIVGTP